MPRDRATETAELVSPEFDRLFVETGADLWRAVYVYTRSRDLAEEVVSETFTRYVERSGSVRNPRAWLYRVALPRKRGAETSTSASDSAARCRGAPTEELVAVLDALGRLPPKQRAAIVMRYRLDMPVREIADVLDISVATAKVHLHRGRNRLRQMLGVEEGTDA
jgi:RNA polymerase sigma-70 factor (ECF subfamily)